MNSFVVQGSLQCVEMEFLGLPQILFNDSGWIALEGINLFFLSKLPKGEATNLN